MNGKVIYKSSISGLIVSKDYAEKNPDTTYRTTVEIEQKTRDEREKVGGEENDNN